MSIEMINKLLRRLSEKTGREWTFSDLMRIAEKLPQANDENVDAVLAELSEMGLEVPPDTRDKILKQLNSQEGPAVEELEEALEQPIKPVSHRVKKKPQAKAGKSRKSEASKHAMPETLLQQALRMQKRRTR